MNKTLVIMAAGMGSRFGGDGSKQTASLGPNGEMLMEYSIHDAAIAGFDKVVFIISQKMNEFFPDIIREKIKADNISFAVQSFDNLPEWYANPEGRTKPYGTVAAIISAAGVVKEPFAVINADDFYGRQAFIDLAAAMDSINEEGEACMVTYSMASTLTHTGGVTRGICTISEQGILTGLDETKNICLGEDDRPYVEQPDGERRYLPADAPVSMNIFGFMPWMMEAMQDGFDEFLKELDDDARMTAEYPIPVFLDRLMSDGTLTIKAFPTESPWFGVTYQADADAVKARLAEMADQYK